MCVEQSAIAGSPLRIIYNMPNFLSGNNNPPLHAAAAFKQRKEFFGGESVLCILCIGKISLPHFLYTVYQIFRCTQIFVGFFDGNKKAPCGAFSNTETFFFCALSYDSRAYALALIISAASICGINLSILLAVMISFFRNRIKASSSLSRIIHSAILFPARRR